jgi:hypothetical protein
MKTNNDVSSNCEKEKLVESAQYIKACNLGGSNSSLGNAIRVIELRERLKKDGIDKSSRMKCNDSTMRLIYYGGMSRENSEQLYNMAVRQLKHDQNIKTKTLNGVIKGAKRQLSHKIEDHAILRTRLVDALRKEEVTVKMGEATLAGAVDAVTADKKHVFEVVNRMEDKHLVTALGKLLIHKLFYPSATFYIASTDKLSDVWRNTFKKFGIGNVVILTNGGLLYYGVESQGIETKT